MKKSCAPSCLFTRIFFSCCE